MKVSVALATFNGARYLQEQLDSLVLQTRMPDELVICDDGSSDGTTEIIEAFAKHSPFTVKFKRNHSTLGYTGNFEECIRGCSGDVVFICDQDDVWFPNKIAVLLPHFRASDKLLVLINDQALTDANLVPLNQTTFANVSQLGFTDDWNVTGCCTVMSKGFVTLALPFPRELFAYDGWIHALAQALGVRRAFPQVLQFYRRHGANASSSMAAREVGFLPTALLREHGMKASVAAWQNEVRSSQVLIARLKRGVTEWQMDCNPSVQDAGGRFSKAIALETKKLELMNQRLHLLVRSRLTRLPGIFKFYVEGGYGAFQGWKSAVKDVLRPRISADQLQLLADTFYDSRALE